MAWAAATIFDDSICRFEKGTVDVELSSERLLGLTHWKADGAGRHEVALGTGVRGDRETGYCRLLM